MLRDSASLHETFEQSVGPYVRKVLQGQDAVIIAYGQTGKQIMSNLSGSGKSYLMQGENNYELEKSTSSDITGERDTRGFLMRACHELFNA